MALREQKNGSHSAVGKVVPARFEQGGAGRLGGAMQHCYELVGIAEPLRLAAQVGGD